MAITNRKIDDVFWDDGDGRGIVHYASIAEMARSLGIARSTAMRRYHDYIKYGVYSRDGMKAPLPKRVKDVS